jgi:signal transduction histidine kinase/DNA-binding response OmpR family regulator
VNAPVTTLALRYERDIVLARQRSRQFAALLGFDGQDQTRISTAVSEIARNAFSYGGGGRVEFHIEGRTPPQVLLIRIVDEGQGIANLNTILDGRYRSPSGMGVGILGARRLMDGFDITTTPGRGTTVELKKLLPRGRRALESADVLEIADQIAKEKPRDAVEEVQRQNQELLRALAELTRRQEELANLNQELEDTNRGVVALYAELDEKAGHLRRADEIKTRFISNMSHEFRTPVNSIQALAALLMNRADGDLNPEQERQVAFIRKAADSLSELVNDLLDLAKLEAGKTVVRPTEFTVAVLFGALRGMLRPLLVNESVKLVFDDVDELPPMYTDEGKVSQILRNFISNALKFTERGEVRVTARLSDDGARIVFSVTDTGIGIGPEHQETIFEEFTQIDHPLQRRVKGTGLGLPLCRKLAGLLGGSVSVTSQLGIGTTFTAEVPIIYDRPHEPVVHQWDARSGQMPVLFVEDHAETLLVYEKYLSGSRFGMVAGRSIREAREALKTVRPRAIVLDILLSGEDTWGLLAELKRRDDTRSIPVLVLSTVEDERKAFALGADAYRRKPLERSQLLETLRRLICPHATRRILLIDDDEIARYVMRQSLLSTDHEVLEASGGAEGLRMAEQEMPDLVFLDLSMPEVDGFEVLDRLSASGTTRDIPVVIVTSHRLDERQRQRLRSARDVIAKDEVSPERLRAVIDAVTGVLENGS